MIVDEKVNRFATNWGVQPTSITLKEDWTTPIDAKNIENNGKDWDEEKDFGDGLAGLGFANINSTGGIVDAGFDFSNFIPDFANWDWHEWALAIGFGYTVYNILKPKVETFKKRQTQLGYERQIYKNRRSKVKQDYPLFA